MGLQRGTRSRATTGALACALAGSVLLGGCGVAGTDWRPGVAAEVGDATLASDTVDDYAGYFCEALDEGSFGDVNAVPRGALRQGVAGNLTLRLAAEQLADEYGVEPGSYYDQVRAQAESGLATLPRESREPLVDVQSAPTYVSEVTLAVGRVLLEQEGGDAADPEAAAARGQEIFLTWLDQQEVELNPSLNIRLDGQGGWEPAGGAGATSVAVSDLAAVASGDGVDGSGQLTPEYTAYVADLPASQRCGGA